MEIQKTKLNLIELPDFKVDISEIPEIKLKSIHFKELKVFDDYFFDFTDRTGCKSFACFFGTNGSGKTTVLDCIQMVFSRFDGRSKEELKVLLGKLVRHIDGKQMGIYNDDDFLITANIQSSLGDYEVQINKKGFIKDHPEKIKMVVYRLCFYARFDQELHYFQLPRDKWKIFKELFESVTGFRIEEQTTLFDQSDDPVQAELLEKYVLGFLVHKPYETITYRECSNGEKKEIKSFSTLLTQEYMPKIILIDDIAMHIELGRHLKMIECMKKCFPKSQIFASTHSYRISRNFRDRSQLYDFRLIRAPEKIKREPWRLYLIDEIQDCISKFKEHKKETKRGKELINLCLLSNNKDKLIFDCEKFLKNGINLFLKDMVEKR